jgi:hypothetical protein
MEVSVVWLGLGITILALLFLLTRAKGVYDAFQNYDTKDEGFVGSSQDDIRLTSCPADYKQFVNNDGQIQCCDGIPNSGKCSGKVICSLSEGEPTCSTWYTAVLDEKGRNKCPPSMPNYFESKDGKTKGCTSGKRKPDGSGPLDNSMKFCKLYTSQRDDEGKVDSCTNVMLLDKTVCFPGSSVKTDKNLSSVLNGLLPARIQCSFGDPSIRTAGTCETDQSMDRFMSGVYKLLGIQGSWKDNFTRWDPLDKINLCSITQKYKIDKTIGFNDLPNVGIDGSMTGPTCDTNLPPNFDLRKGSIIARNFQVSKNYRLSFNIQPLGILKEWANIIHFSSDGSDCCKFGSRSPAIWFFPNSLRLHVRIGDSKDGNWGVDVDGIQLKKDSSFSLECRDKNITITIDGKETKLTQPNERFSGSTTVFGTNPFHKEAFSYVTNMCYRRL